MTWIPVSERLPEKESKGQYIVAVQGGEYPPEWREAWWDGRAFRVPYPVGCNGSRPVFDRVYAWKTVDSPPPRKLTKDEALREATRTIGALLAGAVALKDIEAAEAILPKLKEALEC